MNAAEFSPKSLDDLRSIFDFIAAAHLDAAEKIAQREFFHGDRQSIVEE